MKHALIAELDFPHNWPNLIENLVTKFSLTDFINNKAILLVSHLIFKNGEHYSDQMNYF